MTGVNTILADDPHLTARCSGGRGGVSREQPLRVIVDGRGRTPRVAQVFTEPGKALLAVRVKPDREEAFTQVGVELLELPSEPARQYKIDNRGAFTI